MGLAAHGLHALGLALGSRGVVAGTVAFALLVVAMCGLVWADRVADALPRSARWSVRQAVLHLDPATAFAYAAAGFDRLHDGPVYATYPLASSVVERPGAWATAGLWGAVGLLAGAAALGLDRFGASRRAARSIPA